MILIELHRWRGVGRDRDLFRFHLRLGWLTVALDRASVVGVLRALRQTAGDLRRFVGAARR